MRLREISERVREVLETQPESLFGDDSMHALVQDIQDVQTVYRPIEGSGKKADLVPWLSFSFQPFSGLIEPFNVYPGRFTALQRVHRQPSGLPELVTHVDRALPNASEPIWPDLYASFSHSPKVQTVVKKSGKDPVTLRMYHRCAFMEPDRTSLPAEYCLPGIAEALPEGYPDDGIPGMVEVDGEQLLFLGELVFFNQGRTPHRGKLRNFLLNCVAVSVVSRYVREVVRKSIAEAS